MNYQGTSMRKPLEILINYQHQIKYVGWGRYPKEQYHKDTRLTGGVACLLYLAMAGHNYDEHPNKAAAQRAIDARRALALLNTAESQTALKVLMFWGLKIRPWLGITNLVSLGTEEAVVDKFPIHDLPEYDEEIELTLPKDMPAAARIVAV